MRERWRRLAVQLGYLPQTLHLGWSAARGWTVAWLVFLVLQGLLPVATVHLTRVLVDTLVAAMGHGGNWQALRPALLTVGALAGVLLMGEALQSAAEWVRTAQAERVQDHLSALIHRKSFAVDMAFYESPAYFDRLQRARDEAHTRPLALLEAGGSLIQNGLTVVAMAAVLVPYGRWIPAALLASAAPALLVLLRHSRRYHAWWEATTTHRRRAHYCEMLLTHSSAAAEVRLFDLGGHLGALFQAVRSRLCGERLDLMRRQSLARLGAGLVGIAVLGASMGWMVWRGLGGQVTLGDLALFQQAFSRGQGLMRALLANLAQIYGNSLFLGNLFEFLGLQPSVVSPPRPLPAPATLEEGIAFRNVTFRYPGSSQPALCGFDLEIPAGRTVAVVGPNGAGKSTLIKLLCRFYDPEEGSVTLDGVDLRCFAVEEVRRRMSVLFQFPVFYQATVAQNIALGDLTADPDPLRIREAAEAAGAAGMVARLPLGYQTQLGKWFGDGVELSGGEWQRIALARAFLRRAPIIALDEPTSFMDSWSELDWMDRFRGLARGRTALLITHRFTTAMHADVIYVMKDARVVERGTHAELVALGGLYAESWAAQMEAGAPAAQEVR
ncbi:MAG: ABC transporter ATP-binding protein [Candidatus Latescibacterota bacterium]